MPPEVPLRECVPELPVVAPLVLVPVLFPVPRLFFCVLVLLVMSEPLVSSPLVVPVAVSLVPVPDWLPVLLCATAPTENPVSAAVIAAVIVVRASVMKFSFVE